MKVIVPILQNYNFFKRLTDTNQKADVAQSPWE